MVLSAAAGLLGSAGISVLGGLASGLLNSYSAKNAASSSANLSLNQNKALMKLQNQYNIAAEKRQQQYYEKNTKYLMQQENTAHQREVADLRAAGLNPILSANNGAGVSAASLGSASSVASNQSITEQDARLGDAINTALDGMRFHNEWLMNKSTRAVNDSTIDLNENLGNKYLSEEALNKANKELTEKYAPLKYQAEIDNYIANSAKTQQDLINSKLLTAAQIKEIASNIGVNVASAKDILNRAKLSGRELSFIDRNPGWYENGKRFQYMTGAGGVAAGAGAGFAGLGTGFKALAGAAKIISRI